MVHGSNASETVVRNLFSVAASIPASQAWLNATHNIITVNVNKTKSMEYSLSH